MDNNTGYVKDEKGYYIKDENGKSKKVVEQKRGRGRPKKNG